MKNLILDMKAALLYLSYYQAYESDLNEGEIDFETESAALRYSDIITKIVELGYPDPTTIPYDDDGCPNIEWQSQTFDEPDKFSCIEFYEAIDNDPNYFTL